MQQNNQAEFSQADAQVSEETIVELVFNDIDVDPVIRCLARRS